MDKDLLIKAVDKFLEDIKTKGTSDVVCPVCGTPLIKICCGNSYVVKCGTENCLNDSFRGI